MKMDINCDMGEGMNNEALLMPYISSCNIACGAHAGSIDTIDEVIELAKEYRVKIGAHPSFPDRENFGRKVIDISNIELQKSLENQLSLLKERADLQQQALSHVKLHGALYNLTSVNTEIANVAINAIKNTLKNVSIYAPDNTVFSKIAETAGYKVVHEVFADRNYTNDGLLVSRKETNAILTKKEDVLKHVLKMLHTQKVTTISGIEIPIKAATFCIHGDHDNSIEILQYLYHHLKEKNIEIC